MVIALGVLLVPIVLIMVFFTRIPAAEPTPVDPEPALAVAQAASPYSVARLASTPSGWTCVRARWTAKGDPGLDRTPVVGNTWQLGYLTDQGRYLGLDQRDEAPESLIRGASRGGVADGTSTVAGRTWKRLVTTDGRTRALVLVTDSSTLVLGGDVDYSVLEDFAARLSF